MDPHTLLRGRYRIERRLGTRRRARTYLAHDVRTGRPCVVKELAASRAFGEPIAEVGTLVGSDADKLIELFEREGRILGHLDHPRIPTLVDHFTERAADDLRLYTVQDYVEALALDEWIDSGRHFTEGEVIGLALEITEILEYLHRRSPPLIHRDIKPSNVLFSETEGAFLVDFGSVKDRVAREGLEGATVVGTFDYMPLEQHQGHAVPASDIYALGMTLIAILSHLEPSEMGRRGATLDFLPHVRTSKRFARVLERMVEPNLDRRYHRAADVRRDLQVCLSGRSPAPSRALAAAAGFALVAGVVGMAGLRLVTSVADDGPPPLVVETTPTLGGPTNDPLDPVVARNGVLRINALEDFRYVDRGWPMGLSVSQSPAGGLDDRPYEPLRREPDYASATPRYGYLPLGNGLDPRITYVVDEWDRPTFVVYLDRNNNEDLTDDGPPLVNQGTNRFATAVSLSIDLVDLDGATVTTPYDFWFWITERTSSRGPAQFVPRFYARCHYAGAVDLGGRIFDAVAYEYDRHNGLFAENGIWIDLNEDGELDDTEHFDHGQSVRVDGVVYRIALAYP